MKFRGDSGLKFLKSPRYVHGKLLFLDVHDRRIKSCDSSGTITSERNTPFVPAGLGATPDGHLVVGAAWQRKIYRVGNYDRPWRDVSDVAKHCLSDGLVDHRGGMYVGDVGYNFLDPTIDPVDNGIIVYIDTDSRPFIAADELFLPNGMIISPDNKMLIVAETLRHRLVAFEICRDGNLRNRRVWAQLDESIRPDGICLDCDGRVWVATTTRQAIRVGEGGQIDCEIITDQPVYAVSFGAAGCQQLYLFTADSSDPVITRQNSNAGIAIVEVDVPAAG